MKIFSEDLFFSIMSTKPAGYTARFTVIAEDAEGNPQEDAVITLTAAGYTQSGNHIDVAIGTSVHWVATGTAYNEQSGDVNVIGDTELKVTLTAQPMRTYTITPVPSDSTVTMTSGVISSSTGTIQVPKGSTVSWAVGHANMNGKSGTRVVPANESEGMTITETKTLTATISLSEVSPSNADVTWRIGTGNPTHDSSVTADVDKAVSLVISKAGYQNYTRNFPENGATYLTNTTIQPVTLTPTSLTCTVSTTTTGATVTMKVNGVQKAQSTNSATVNCIVGDVITWTVSKTGFQSQSGTYNMGTSSASLPPVTLTANSYNVVISASVSNATVRIMSGGNVIATGTGSATTQVTYGTYITYSATLADVTANGNGTVYNSYSDSLVLNAKSSSVAVITTSQTVVLPYGTYRVLAVSGGAGGKASSGNPTYNSSTPKGANGGGGGGSGGVKVFTLSVTNTAGASCAFTIGNGGSANTDGGATSVQLTGQSAVIVNGGLTTQEGNSGYQYGGSSYEGSGGGSGGGGGGTYAIVSGTHISPGSARLPSIHGSSIHYVTVSSQNGGRGGISGYNGEARSYGGGSTGTRAVPGGTGLYQQESVYANNAGTKGTDGTLNATLIKGHAGSGGTGVVSVQSSLTNTNTFSSFSESQLLALAIGNLSGGGGGGSTGTPPTSSSSSGTINAWGGAGGGGGGWNNGTGGSDNTPGTGGKGAVLYMRIGWPS